MNRKVTAASQLPEKLYCANSARVVLPKDKLVLGQGQGRTVSTTHIAYFARGSTYLTGDVIYTLIVAFSLPFSIPQESVNSFKQN
jgi:hypothetical protein